MKTFLDACKSARMRGIDPSEQWLMVKAILMSSIILKRDEPLPKTRKAVYYSYRIPDLLQYHKN
jgi:hypothetical protein